MGQWNVRGIVPAPALPQQIKTPIIALAALRWLVKVLAMPKSLLIPSIALLCVIGSYALRNTFFDVYVMTFFGLLGLAIRWLQMPLLPLLLALVLGRQLEEHLRGS